MNWFALIYGGLTGICLGHVFFSWLKKTEDDRLFEMVYFAILGAVGLLLTIYELVHHG